MAKALEISARALPQCRPNPPVGCVLVARGQLVSWGFTQCPGRDHAEAAALRRVGVPPPATTAYVTLEPCAFQGRTPSCARSLVQARISKVYVSVVDPDPRNNGTGIDLLIRAGVPVEVGLLADQVAAFLKPYLL